MQIFVSTTCLGVGRTDLAEVLPRLLDLPVDGVELGSTHLWRADLDQIVTSFQPARLLSHNYFPPARQDLVLNIASTDAEVRHSSLAHAHECIDFASRCGVELYTIHPGFVTATAKPAAERSQSVAFDFEFSGRQASPEESFTVLRDSLDDLLSYARTAGVRLAIETEGSVTRPGMLLMERPEEYRRLLEEFGNDLLLNFNLAHTSLAAAVHQFDLAEFISEFRRHFAAVELSDNNGRQDEHLPLVPGSYVFKWLELLPDVPLIMEFREASIDSIRDSAEILRACSAPVIG
jgi:sugar phosphate isomerase/epimerase